MKYITSLVLILFWYGDLICQQTNPFEIPKNHLRIVVDSVNNSLRTATPKSVVKNPFEIRTEHSATSKVSEISTPTNQVTTETKVIVLVYFLIMLVILTMAVSINRKRFSNTLKAVYNSNQLRALYRDSKAWSNGQSIILYVFFLINCAFIIWLTTTKLNTETKPNLFTVIVALLAIYAIRHFVMWAIANIYEFGDEPVIHSYSIALHNQVLGVLLLPFVLFIEFFQTRLLVSILLAAAGITVILYFLRQTKSLLMALGIRGFNPFYFFIYLCAIEIAPLMVAYKILMGAL